MDGWSILAALTILILLVFFLPYGVDVGYADEVLRVGIKAGPLRVWLLPKKPLTEKKRLKAEEKKAKKEARRAARAAKKAAAAKGLTIKVETQGQVGEENDVTPAEIKACKAVIIAADKDVQPERFEGKPLISVGVTAAIKDPEGLIDKALAAKLAGLGIPSFACTPDLFPGMMAAAIRKEDVNLWAAKQAIVVPKG